MFVLLVVKDTVPVPPKTFGLSPSVTILDALNKKYANKLIPEKGLALSVFDILTAEDGKVTWGNGMMYYKVSIRLMLFAPFHSEIIVGKVVETTSSYYLWASSRIDIISKRFFWYSDEDEKTLTVDQLLSTVIAQRLYIDVGEPIRFRVDSIDFQDIRPDPPVILEPGAKEEAKELGEPVEATKDPYKSAGFRILGTIAESGLGLVSWWDGSAAEGDEDEEMEP
ncbi:uncharacterized protein MKK02DRAFT_33531 [Dioszegia hungarica]|uniref:Uncharacterized protein n=1 Tax=Dioszegia hungarica TaxID=4972 RepID=A0AA38H8I7_9TREE|nr:uncharacterized protein MKK02DRAFT_33531 [Dioszegia hungarica]KAI9636308.1 hypothetical protein MKK02DRAFT_33531 [Dioszegia hungarica]